MYLKLKLNDMITMYEEFESSIQNRFLDENDVLDILNNRIQTFITTTSIDGIEHHVIKEAKKININHREEK